MTTSGGSSWSRSSKIDSFNERVENLLDELTFSIRADRPSLLLAPYASEFVRQEVEDRLEKCLQALDQRLVRLDVSPVQFDIPQLLSRHLDRKAAVFSISHLSMGGGKADANAYKALNIRRELLVDYRIRALFWLTGTEARQLSRHAPDFWAFRHRVVEFNRPADINHLGIRAGDTPLRMLQAGRKTTRLAPETAEPWLELGRLYLQVGLLPQARQSFLRLLALDPRSPSGWLGLGDVYRLGKNYSDAIINYQQVIGLEPQNTSAHIALIACYRLSGQVNRAAEQMELAHQFMEHAHEYARASLASVCGNPSQAVELLKLALEKHQVRPDELKHDPNMDFIRSNPGFIQLFASPLAGGNRSGGK